MEEYKLFDSEYKFMSIIWELEPIASGELVKVCYTRLGWKKSTTYTVLKKLVQKNLVANTLSTVTALVPQQQVQAYESQQMVEKSFGGSLPQFLTAFLSERKLSSQEALEIKQLIDSYEEKEGE